MDSTRGSSPLSSLPTSRSSSPLSSLGSRSPSPPPEIRAAMSYSRALLHVDPSLPTPPPSQDNSLKGSPVPDAMDSTNSSDKDGPPPAKRRRVSAKERTTEHLDLRHSRVKASEQDQLDSLLRVLHKRRKIVVIAGAGISVAAGSKSNPYLALFACANISTVPDFRSSTGLFNSLKAEHNLKGSGKDLFDASVYRDETSTSTFHSMVSSMSRMTKDAKPTLFHHMLATLAQEGRLLRLYSQNVDGIDTSLEPLSTAVPLRKDENGKWPKTVQLHGGLDKMVCSKCQTLSDLDADLFDGPVAPLCSSCEVINDIRTNVEGKRSHGIGRLRPRMVLYNEHNPDDEAIGKVASEDLRRRPDAIIVVGTTLKVPGIQRIAREMCGIVRDRKDGMAIWINNDPPPAGPQFADCWDLIVKGPADAVATHAALRQWDDPVTAAELDNISDEEVILRASANTASVVLPSSNIPSQLAEVPLPPGHINNSFRPPSTIPSTPHRPRAPAHSPDFSPTTSRRSSVLPSIEENSDGDNITVAESGLLTPSKSQKSTPPTMPTIMESLKDGAKLKKPAPKKNKAAGPAKKQSNVKYIKMAKSQAKPNPKTKALKAQKQKSNTGGQSLSMSFSVSKGTRVEVQSKKVPGAYPSPTKAPSKLSEVSNVSPDTLHPLSPSDPRNNLSPMKSRPSFPNLSSPEKAAQTVRRTMSVANVMN